ncbi:MAG: hypothetical protein WCH99_05660 [Verrucomicrobiota bacterium]
MKNGVANNCQVEPFYIAYCLKEISLLREFAQTLFPNAAAPIAKTPGLASIGGEKHSLAALFQCRLEQMIKNTMAQNGTPAANLTHRLAGNTSVAGRLTKRLT